MLHLSTQDVVSSIEKTPLVNLNGIFYQEYLDFFDKSFEIDLSKVSKFVKLEKLEHTPRGVVSKKSEISKLLTVFFMHSKITKALENKFMIPLKFDSVDLWIDDIGFSLEPHVDDERIRLHLQIYLSDNSVGTSLYDQSKHKIRTFNFKQNTGYALLNNAHSIHGVEKVTQSGRTSIYARYS